MKRSSRELKRIARDFLNNRYSIPMGAFVIAGIITAIIETPFSLLLHDYPSVFQIVTSLLAYYLITLIGLVLNIGIISVHLNMSRGSKFGLKQIIEPFLHNTERYFLLSFLFSLSALFSCIPLIGCGFFFYLYDGKTITAPVLIFAGVLTAILLISVILNYGLVFFLLLDQPDAKVTSLFHKSRLIMKKNKGRFLYLLLSLLPWCIPIFCSFGIASLWLCPYMTQIFTVFYLDCTGELNQIPVRNYAAESEQSETPRF